MLKLARLNAKTLTIKSTWQGTPVRWGRYKNLFSVCSVDVNKRQLCDLEPILLRFSQTAKREYGNFSFPPYTLLKPPSSITPTGCFNHEVFTFKNRSQRECISFNVYGFFSRH